MVSHEGMLWQAVLAMAMGAGKGYQTPTTKTRAVAQAVIIISRVSSVIFLRPFASGPRWFGACGHLDHLAAALFGCRPGTRCSQQSWESPIDIPVS